MRLCVVGPWLGGVQADNEFASSSDQRFPILNVGLPDSARLSELYEVAYEAAIETNAELDLPFFVGQVTDLGPPGLLSWCLDRLRASDLVFTMLTTASLAISIEATMASALGRRQLCIGVGVYVPPLLAGLNGVTVLPDDLDGSGVKRAIVGASKPFL